MALVLCGCAAIVSAALGALAGLDGARLRARRRQAAGRARADAVRARRARRDVEAPPHERRSGESPIRRAVDVEPARPPPSAAPAPAAPSPRVATPHRDASRRGRVARRSPPRPVGEDTSAVSAAMRALRVERNPVRARALLARYLGEHPNGSLAEEALAMSIEAAVAHHDADVDGAGRPLPTALSAGIVPGPRASGAGRADPVTDYSVTFCVTRVLFVTFCVKVWYDEVPLTCRRCRRPAPR